MTTALLDFAMGIVALAILVTVWIIATYSERRYGK